MPCSAWGPWGGGYVLGVELGNVDASGHEDGGQLLGLSTQYVSPVHANIQAFVFSSRLAYRKVEATIVEQEGGIGDRKIVSVSGNSGGGHLCKS